MDLMGLSAFDGRGMARGRVSEGEVRATDRWSRASGLMDGICGR
jgi:hypothetical protein